MLISFFFGNVSNNKIGNSFNVEHWFNPIETRNPTQLGAFHTLAVQFLPITPPHLVSLKPIKQHPSLRAPSKAFTKSRNVKYKSILSAKNFSRNCLKIKHIMAWNQTVSRLYQPVVLPIFQKLSRLFSEFYLLLSVSYNFLSLSKVALFLYSSWQYCYVPNLP